MPIPHLRGEHWYGYTLDEEWDADLPEEDWSLIEGIRQIGKAGELAGAGPGPEPWELDAQPASAAQLAEASMRRARIARVTDRPMPRHEPPAPPPAVHWVPHKMPSGLIQWRRAPAAPKRRRRAVAPAEMRRDNCPTGSSSEYLDGLMTIATAIVGVATVAVLVSRGSAATEMIEAAGRAFAADLEGN